MTVSHKALLPHEFADSADSLSDDQLKALTHALELIAPAWPLDQMIAVNPLWQLRQLPRDKVAARLAALAGVRCLMEPGYYLERWQRGEVLAEDLASAGAELGSQLTPVNLHEALEHQAAAPAPWRKLSDLLDATRSPRQMSWQEEILHQVSQFCAAHCQQQKPLLARTQANQSGELYRHWLQNIQHDRGISVLMSAPALCDQFRQLPEQAESLLAIAITELGISPELLELYCHALLLEVNGWASHLAWRAWHQQDTNRLQELQDLLAIRMAWELALWRYTRQHQPALFATLAQHWQEEKALLPTLIQQHQQHQLVSSIWARALEIHEQNSVRGVLVQGVADLATDSVSSAQAFTTTLQAVFCIDVRSEPMRRALEAQGEHIETFGFAGFFGLPIACQPDATAVCRPQLPGLLAAQLTATPVSAQSQLGRAQQQANWQRWGESAAGTFVMVESAGWWYALSLLRQTLKPVAMENPVNLLTHETQWQLKKDGQVLDVSAQADLVQPILTAMGISQFAATVMLVGHGSHTANNLQAAGLDCGACGGQSGEVNVRVLANLLNDVALRVELTHRGVGIPADTRFVAALHNTTTDQIDCFDADVLRTIHPVLEAARDAAQRKRAHHFADIDQLSPVTTLNKQFLHRSEDWSQPRPEWGLANNKAFVIAPRAWTRNADLQGRVFLHDYNWQADTQNNYSVLELLMTAPMIVTHWINMQYNLSMTDNHKYGSGNKLLHNAVGGNLGMFEGNAGDLRIGLAHQSLHNGQHWMHTPVRLAVYIAAPTDAIDEIVARHTMLQELINHDWIELYQWQPSVGFARLYQERWTLNLPSAGGQN